MVRKLKIFISSPLIAKNCDGSNDFYWDIISV